MYLYRIFKLLTSYGEYSSEIMERVSNGYLPIAFYDKKYGEVQSIALYERGVSVLLIVLEDMWEHPYLLCVHHL